MNTGLLKVAIRQNALVIPEKWGAVQAVSELKETTLVLLKNCRQLGFTFSEPLLHTINGLPPTAKIDIFDVLREVTGVKKNWTPLIKQWDIPTGESRMDHIITFFTNLFTSQTEGTRLACGHIIPPQTFPLDRYNGCPFCGTPFEFGELNYEPTKNKLKVLELWTEQNLHDYLVALLASPIVLDATQIDNLKVLLTHMDLPKEVNIGIKETLMLVIDTLVELDKVDEAGRLFGNPNDVLRYLWYKHTGFLQIIRPKVVIQRSAKNAGHLHRASDRSTAVKAEATNKLKLKYTRAECKRYAQWLNQLTLPIDKQCEIMHPKRNMWVRVIRALRLAEYSKRKGFERLAKLLDTFYNERYDVWQGQLNAYKLNMDEANAFKLLKQRPGVFARSLFSYMLWFGKDVTLKHFREILPELPPRLVFTLNMYTDVYFHKNGQRIVKPLGGTNKQIPTNKLLDLYTDENLEAMQADVQTLCLEAMQAKFAKVETDHKTIFIAEELHRIPIAVGDRSEQIQDLPVANMGTRFPVEGNQVRLFMQWGEGLAAQHLDMDLSCKVAYAKREEFCSYSRLTIACCQHSGDIREIPAKVGTAEYINIDLEALTKLEAKYVSFTCNAYTRGSLTPNLVVGWMNSASPMEITPKGVAYNPTAVQHQVRITQGLTKGMVFGVLDMAAREIIWLELAFGGQIVQNLNVEGVETMLKKLEAKLKIGELLQIKAQAQGLQMVDTPEEADEVYAADWALKTKEVNQLFFE